MIRLAVLLCLVLFSSGALTQERLSEAAISAVDAMFAPFDRDGSPGYAVGVVKNGSLAFARGYGRSDLDNNIHITPRTSFHLASLSKQFTAAAVALLILDGKLSLDTPLKKFFPEAKAYGATPQIKHLIYFTSGLQDYTSLPRPNRMPWFSFYYFTVDDAISWLP